MIAVLLPVLNRPQRVQPVLDSLRLSGYPVRPFFICSFGDTAEIQAVEAARAEYLLVPWPAAEGDYARKINYGLGYTEEPWIFTGADDLHFHPEWAVEAMAVATQTGKRVIGTVDLGNPEVRRGSTATHFLVARSYAEELGGTMDDTGRVFSEAYDHNFVDRELASVAIFRDEWAFAPNSVVEHLHYHWGKGDGEDDTYRKAMRLFGHDGWLYTQRMQQAGVPIQ